MNPILSHGLIGLCTLIIGISVGYNIGRRDKVKLQTLSQIGVAIISLLALTGLFVAINQYRDATTCQSSYNKAFTKAITDRAEATDTDRHATRVALDAILDPASNQEKRLKALLDWRTQLQKADQARATSPIPDIPGCATKEQ